MTESMHDPEGLFRSTGVGDTIRLRISKDQLDAEVRDRISPILEPTAIRAVARSSEDSGRTSPVRGTSTARRVPETAASSRSSSGARPRTSQTPVSSIRVVAAAWELAPPSARERHKNAPSV